MPHTLLGICQEFAVRTGLPVPSSVVGNNDPGVRQIRGLLGQVLEDLTTEHGTWQVLNKQGLFTSVAAEDQGSIDELAPYGFRYFINGTFFDRTQRLPFYGPLNAEQWQAVKALPSSGPFYKYRILGNRLLVNPLPAAGHTIAFEYASTFAVKSTLADNSTPTYVSYPQKDADTFLFPDDLILAGLRWMYKSEKGLNYAEDFRRYESKILQLKGRDGTKPELSMDQAYQDFKPGIFVPYGNWPTGN